MKRRVRDVGGWAWLLGGVLLGAALLASCGQVSDGAALGGETHFLVTCGEGCGDGLSCIDGACTRRCEPGFSSCSELATEAECLSTPDDAGERAVFGGKCDLLCDGDADCAPLGTGYVCRSGACRAEPEDRQAELTLMQGAPLVRAVNTDTCETGLRWVGGDRASAEMHPGSDCMSCHDDASARPLLLGGTVYPTGKYGSGVGPLDDCFGLEGIVVSVMDDDGRERSTVTNRAGNFYFEGRESELVWPYTATIRWTLRGRPVETPMSTRPVYGGCARCHDGRLSFEEYGQQPYTPPPNDYLDPDYVIPAFSPVFPPGLYP